MTKIGYARTSTVEQNLDSQIIALKAVNCEIIRTEQKSGNNLADRRELNNILDFIHKDEYLVVTRIDRLARSLKDLQIIVERLKAKGAHLYAIEQPVDTSTATGKAFFDMLGVFNLKLICVASVRLTALLPLRTRVFTKVDPLLLTKTRLSNICWKVSALAKLQKRWKYLGEQFIR